MVEQQVPQDPQQQGKNPPPVEGEVDPLEATPEDEVPRITRKQRMLEAQGREVSPDYFLFSCLEHERLLRYKGEADPHVITWPALADEDEVTNGTWTNLLQRMASWYREHFAALTDRQAIDHEKISEVVPPLVGFNQDVERLYRAKNAGGELPKFDKSKAVEAVWEDVAKEVKGNFAQHGELYLKYLHWSHAVEPVEDFAPGDMPPVGRYAPPMFRPRDDRGGRGGPGGGRFGGDRGGRGGDRDRGPRSGASRGGEGGGRDRDRGDRGPRRAEAEGRGDRPDRGPRPDRGDRPDRGPRPDRGDRPDRGPRRDRGDRGGRGRGGENPELEAQALADVDQALAQLKANPSQEEVTLKPTNSFYRRIQHQRIVDNGFHSFSVGEGADRAVKVSRKE